MGIAATQRGGVYLLLLLSGFAHVAFAMETTTIPKQDFQIPSNEFEKIEMRNPAPGFSYWAWLTPIQTRAGKID